MKTLREVITSQDPGYDWRANKSVAKLIDARVEERSGVWPGKHRNVHVWWETPNGYAVGFNENPSTGWSWPVAKIKSR